ncbi:PAS domain-containing protein [Phenylobacterium sp.]|uniref:PAS domain-containing protein n=1 Tax=Phenylobacterium sp. TaxID=1871053 RepID=UPI0035B0C599
MMGSWAQRFVTAIERPIIAAAAVLGSVAVAAGLRVVVGQFVDPPPNYMTFYPAVLFASLLTGARGGMLATVVSAALVAALWQTQAWEIYSAVFVVTAAATVLVGRAIRIAVLRGAQAEARFKIFQEHALDGFVILEPVRRNGRLVDFRCAYSNPAAAQMAPASSPGLTGYTIHQSLPAEHAELMFARLAEVFRRGEADDVEVRRVIDGQPRYFRSSAVPVPEGLAVTFRDVTLERMSANALRAGEARVRALVDSLPQLIWSTRADGTVDYLSPQWIAFTGEPPETHFGEAWLAAVHPEDRDAAAESWRQAVSGGLPYHVEYRLRRNDGAWRWVQARATAIYGRNGRVRRWFGTCSDITEIVEARTSLEARVAERTQELERSIARRIEAEAALAQAHRLETVGRLTGGVAHDFNNLLTVVIGGLDMILANPKDTARVVRLAEAALGAGRRGERLTRQLLAFSRRQELKLEAVDVQALIEQVEPLVRRAVGEAISLTVRCPEPVGASRLDSAQFEAALLNLVVNAADAAPQGHGDIEIAVERQVLTEGETPGAAAGAYVVVSVSDNGAGMSASTLEHAFEPFFTTKDIGKGTGLGLAQVYGFVKQVGGAVTIESSVGFGTTVRLFLPAAALEAPVEAPAHPGEPHAWGKGARVLLVEDDAAVRAVTESLLTDFGCEVEGAADGPSALDRLRAGERYDLLISDIVMPGGMSGVELAHAAQARDARLPIVLTTGYAGERLSQGADDLAWPLLRKPFRAEQLGLAVREALERSRETAV